MTYNPFMGANQTVQKNSDGVASFNSFVIDDVDNILAMDEDEQRRKRKNKKPEENEKKRLAELLEQIVYQLEKLRFILEKNIFPRDMTLRLFDYSEPEYKDLSNQKSKLSISQLNNNRQLILAYKQLDKLH